MFVCEENAIGVIQTYTFCYFFFIYGRARKSAKFYIHIKCMNKEANDQNVS